MLVTLPKEQLNVNGDDLKFSIEGFMSPLYNTIIKDIIYRITSLKRVGVLFFVPKKVTVTIKEYYNNYCSLL